jgi:hypothetical protein
VDDGEHADQLQRVVAAGPDFREPTTRLVIRRANHGRSHDRRQCSEDARDGEKCQAENRRATRSLTQKQVQADGRGQREQTAAYIHDLKCVSGGDPAGCVTNLLDESLAGVVALDCRVTERRSEGSRDAREDQRYAGETC